MKTVNMKDVVSIKPGKRPLKVAHFAQFGPHSAGISGTAIDMILAERAVGIDAQLIDFDGTKKPSKVGLERSGVITVGPSIAKTADILVRHSAIPPAIKNLGIPIVMCLHGRPEYTFLLDYSKKHAVINCYLNSAKDPQYAGFITFWKQHLDYLNILLPKTTIDYVPAMVDLDLYNPKGIKYDYSDIGGSPNILITDMFREDVNPFNMLLAASTFIREYYPKGKAHIYGMMRLKESPVKELIGAMKAAGVLGDVQPLVRDMDRIYRSADMLITPHVIATRVVREALASGLPIVGGNGNPYTVYQANHLDVPGFAAEMARCWDTIKGKKQFRQEARQKAEFEFNPKTSGEYIKDIFERILKNKPKTKLKPKGETMIYNFIPYAPGEKEELGKTYNRYMELLKDNDWACFLDHDAMFTTTDWYHQLQEIIADNPEYSCLSAVTNRIGNPQQKIANLKPNHDMIYHRKIGSMSQDQNRTTVIDVTDKHCISGVVILVKKSAWKKAGGFKDGFLGIDNKFHQSIAKAGMKVGVCRGLYVYHYYRADENSELKPIEA